jgi:hypothetical protein
LLVDVPPPEEVPEEPVPPLLVPPDVPPAEVPPEVPEDVPPVAAPEVPEEPVPPVDPVAPVAPVDPVEPVAPLEPVEPVVAGVLVVLGDVSVGEEDVASALLFDADLDDEAAPSETFSGAISSGVCLGTVSCPTLLPPHALSPPVARSSRTVAPARARITGEAWIRLRTAPSAEPCGGRRPGSR